MERVQNMPPEQRERILARLRQQQGDSAAGAESDQAHARARAGDASAPRNSVKNTHAETIDALFAPLPPTESTGRVWLYINKQLKSVRLRLGISDGTNTELLSGELQPNTELVTNVIANVRQSSSGAGQSPLMGPPRGGFGQPGGRPGGGTPPRGR
jgi:hypothetical protein